MTAESGTGDQRVIILTAGVGAGHDGAAEAWAERLSHAGYKVQIHDLLGVLRRKRRPRIAGAYEAVLHRAPWIYQSLFAVATRPVGVVVARALMGGALPKVADLLGVRHRRIRRDLFLRPWRQPAESVPTAPAAVLCTYPIAGHVLGELRRQRRLQAPVLTFLTDFSVHRLCVAPGVDAHLAVHRVSAEQAEACGGRPALVCGPVVAERFGPGRTDGPVPDREQFGLPAGVRLALLVAGSWGVGDVEVTAAEIAATGVAIPVVVCGRNERLRARLQARGIGIALGWVDDMPALMSCVDVLVENAGGLTSLEAMSVGLPVASYRPIAGHGRMNAEALADAGVTSYIQTPEELAPTLRDLIDGPRGRAQRERARGLFSADPVQVLQTAVRSVAVTEPEPAEPEPAPPLRVRSRILPASAARPTAVWVGQLARPLVGLGLFALAATVGGNTSSQFAVAHGIRSVRPSGQVATSYLVVRPGPDTNLSGRTQHLLRETSAAVAIDGRFAEQRPGTVQALSRAGVPILVTEPQTHGPDLNEVRNVRSSVATIYRLTGSRPTLFVPASRVDAIDLGIVTSLHDRVVEPRVRLDSDRPVTMGAAQVVLIDCTHRPCELPLTLTMIRADARQSGIPLGSIAALADEPGH